MERMCEAAIRGCSCERTHRAEKKTAAAVESAAMARSQWRRRCMAVHPRSGQTVAHALTFAVLACWCVPLFVLAQRRWSKKNCLAVSSRLCRGKTHQSTNLTRAGNSCPYPEVSERREGGREGGRGRVSGRASRARILKSNLRSSLTWHSDVCPFNLKSRCCQ